MQHSVPPRRCGTLCSSCSGWRTSQRALQTARSACTPSQCRGSEPNLAMWQADTHVPATSCWLMRQAVACTMLVLLPAGQSVCSSPNTLSLHSQQSFWSPQPLQHFHQSHTRCLAAVMRTETRALRWTGRGRRPDGWPAATAPAPSMCKQYYPSHPLDAARPSLLMTCMLEQLRPCTFLVHVSLRRCVLVDDAHWSSCRWEPQDGGFAVSAPYKGHTASVEDIQWSPTEATVRLFEPPAALHIAIAQRMLFQCKQCRSGRTAPALRLATCVSGP